MSSIESTVTRGIHTYDEHINSTVCHTLCSQHDKNDPQINTINVLLIGYILTCVSSSFLLHVCGNSWFDSALLRCFDLRTNLLKVTSDERSIFTRIRFINSIRVVSLLTLLLLHPLHPVYKSIKMYFFVDWSLFVRKVSSTDFSITTLVTCINYMLSACMYTVIWIPNLRKAGGFISLISFLCVRSAATTPALLVMLLIIRSLPNYRIGGRSIFIFIQRVTLARIINWYLKYTCSRAHSFPFTRVLASSDVYLYTGGYLLVKSLLWKKMITHSIANSLLITLMVLHNFAVGRMETVVSLLQRSLNSSDLFQVTLLFLLSNASGVLLGVLLRNHLISVKYSLHLKVTGYFFLFTCMSLVSHLLFSDNSFLLTAVIVFTTCSALCSIAPLVYYNESSLINRVLSHRVMSPVSKLFYSMLLAHPFVNELLSEVNVLSNAHSQVNLMVRYMMTVVTLVPLSLVINVFIEAPFYSVTRYLMYPEEVTVEKEGEESSPLQV